MIREVVLLCSLLASSSATLFGQAAASATNQELSPVQAGATASGAGKSQKVTFPGTVAIGSTSLVGDGAGPVNAKAMGARGNGTTDDTAALLAGQAKAIALGVPFYLPGGTYLITSGFTLASGENWNFDGGASLLVGSASGLTVFNCGVATAGHSSISIQGARITANGANQYTYTGLAGACINSHIQIKAYYPNVGMALNFAEENILDLMVFKGKTAGIQFINQSNGNILSSVNVVGTEVAGSIGVSFDASSSANQFAASEISRWGVGLSNSGRANTINGEWLEYNTIGVQALAGSMSLCGGNGGAMTIADGAIVNGGYGCLSPNQPNHRVSALNLAAYYPMNEGAGSTLYDWSGNGRDATLSGSYTWGPGPYGSSITLPNSTSGANKISIPASAISYTSPFTVAILDRAGTAYDSAQPITLWMADNSGHNAYFTSTVTGTAARLNFSSGWQRNINNAELMGTGKWRWTFVVFDPVANTTQSIDPSNPDVAPVPSTAAWPLTGTPASIWIENAGASTVDTFLFGSVAIWQRALTIEEAKSWIEQESIYAAAARPAGLSLTTLGDTLYRGSTGPQRLAGNTSKTRKFLTQTGDGTKSAAPQWTAVTESMLPNTLGCVDGYDHLPCVVYAGPVLSERSPSGSYATVFTTEDAGLYRISGSIYATSEGGTSYVVGEHVSTTLEGTAAPTELLLAEVNASTGKVASVPSAVCSIDRGVNIQARSTALSGTAGGAWNRFITIERLR
jgi:hypothetical protein